MPCNGIKERESRKEWLKDRQHAARRNGGKNPMNDRKRERIEGKRDRVKVREENKAEWKNE